MILPTHTHTHIPIHTYTTTVRICVCVFPLKSTYEKHLSSFMLHLNTFKEVRLFLCIVSFQFILPPTQFLGKLLEGRVYILLFCHCLHAKHKI